MQPEDRLVFMHVEKTAGSTVHHVLSQNFEQNEVCPHRFDNLNYYPPDYLARYRFFMLHSHLRMMRTIPKPLKFATFLREPVARVISHYRFWASLNDRVVEAEGLDHIRFLKARKLKELLTPSPLGVMPEFWNLSTHRLAGDLLLAPAGRPWRDESEMLESALANLASCATVGITEYPDLSFQCLAEDLGIPNRYDGARINVTAANSEREPDRYDPVFAAREDDETLEAIDRATQLDKIIYDAALARFEDRLRRGFVVKACVPPHLRTHQLEGEEIVVGDHAHGAVVYGPYHTLPAGRYRATLWVQADVPKQNNRTSSIDVDVCSDGARVIHASRAVHRFELSENWFEPIEIDFSTAAATDNVEVRLHTCGVRAIAVRRSIAIRLL